MNLWSKTDHQGEARVSGESSVATEVTNRDFGKPSENHSRCSVEKTPHAQSSSTRNTRRSCRLPQKKQQSLAAAFRCATTGLVTNFLRERNLKIHGAALIFMLLLGLVCRVSPVEWAVLILTAALVISLECVNSAIEAVVDLVSPDYHELAGLAKDAAAGAVLVAAVASVLIACLIFIPALISRFLS